MTHIARAGAGIAAVTLVLISCGADKVSGPREPDAVWPIIVPRPLHANAVVDTPRAVRRLVSARAGAVLTTTGADGATYSLTIPDNALFDDTEIVMTPVVRLDGVRFREGRLYGVDLQPNGLTFLNPVLLEILPPEGSRIPAVGMSYEAGGRSLHGYPLVRDPNRIAMHLLHFSGALVQTGENAWAAPADPDRAEYDALFNYSPEAVQQQLENLLAELFNEERKAQLTGTAGDPDLQRKVQFILRAYYVRIVEPLLPRMETSCRSAQVGEGIATAINWLRQTQLLGHQFPDESERVEDSLAKAYENCFREVVGTCVVWQDWRQATRVLAWMRVLLLIGGFEENTLPPHDGCEIWTGHVTYVYRRYSQSGTSETIHRSSVDPVFAWWGSPQPGTAIYRVAAGQLRWDYTSQWPPCSEPQTIGFVDLVELYPRGELYVGPDDAMGGSGTAFPITTRETCTWTTGTTVRDASRTFFAFWLPPPKASMTLDATRTMLRGEYRTDTRDLAPQHDVQTEERWTWDLRRRTSRYEDVLPALRR